MIEDKDCTVAKYKLTHTSIHPKEDADFLAHATFHDTLGKAVEYLVEEAKKGNGSVLDYSLSDMNKGGYVFHSRMDAGE